MKKIGKIFKNKKVLIGSLILFLLIVIASIVFITLKKDKNTKEYTEEMYTMYIKINPLVKIEFSEGYYICTENKKQNACSDKTNEITNFVLINDDAKEIYKDIDLEGLSLIDALVYIYDTAKEKGIEFDTIEIVANYEVDPEKLEEDILSGSKYKTELNIVMNYEENLEEESVIESIENNVYYNVTFDSNGGSTIESIKVKNGYGFTQPNNPKKEGYEFVEWQLDGKKYDFSSKVTKDITLKAKWNKIEKQETNKTDNSTQSSGKTENSSSNNNSTQTNSNKINLSDNITVTVGTEYVQKGCYFIMFTTNFETVFPDANIIKGSYNSVSYWGGLKAETTSGEVSEEELTEKWSLLNFDTTKEDKLINLLKKYSSGTYAGIKNVEYSIDNHRITFSYNYIDFEKTTAHKEIKNAMSGGLKFNGPCGGIFSEEKTLTKELCNEYNLSCE